MKTLDEIFETEGSEAAKVEAEKPHVICIRGSQAKGK